MVLPDGGSTGEAFVVFKTAGPNSSVTLLQDGARGDIEPTILLAPLPPDNPADVINDCE